MVPVGKHALNARVQPAEKPRRGALIVVRRYAEHYDSVVATAPVVSLSSISLSRALIRVQEKPFGKLGDLAKRKSISAKSSGVATARS
jgi:hypothetical protein